MNDGATPADPAPGPSGGPRPGDVERSDAAARAEGPAAGSDENTPADGIAATPEGAADLVPGGRPDEQRADETEPPSRAARRRRLQALAGLTVHGSDGKVVGRVRDIFQQDAGGELAAIAVMPRQLSARSVLIPASAIAALPEESTSDQPADTVLTLLVDTARAKAGARPPLTLHATPQDLREAARALGLEEASVVV